MSAWPIEKLITLAFFGLSFINLSAQDQHVADSLAKVYAGANNLPDSAKMVLLTDLSFNETRNLVKAVDYAETLINLAKLAGNDDYQRRGYFNKGTKKRLLGHLDEALEAYLESAKIAIKTHHLRAEGQSYGAIGDTYSFANNHASAIFYYNKAISTLTKFKDDSTSLASVLSNTGNDYLQNKNYDSARFYFNEAKIIFDKINYLPGRAYTLGHLGMVYAHIGKNELAEANINEAISILQEPQDYYAICDFLVSLADIYLKKGDNKAALTYASRSLRLAEQYGLKVQISKASIWLSEFYAKAGNTDQAFMHYKKHILYRDSVNDIKKVEEMAELRTNFEVSQKQIEVNLLNQQKETQRILTISLGVILGLTVVLLGVLFKNNQNKQKAYKLLNLQKQETDAEKLKAENALLQLQLTQKHLIHAAKMASLGELMAGIAHEIQNPLNFVNNFSESSLEMLEEFREDTVNKLSVSDRPQGNGIINDLANNLKKIYEHGKRADTIVRGMLQHSVGSTGKKEPTDINALVQECLRVSYHGLRAKDKEFNVNITTDVDNDIGNIEVVPQEIGRVFLNLFNNAFYSVNEKRRQQKDVYQPAVHVVTRKVGDRVDVRVRDNGLGIPQKAFDKIFHPFFTTKPPGHGTGLGLSLSYDIIESHGGEFKVDAKEGEFAEFSIQLPVADNAIAATS